MVDLQEIEAIKRLKYKYMRCLDQKRWDEMADCFVEEATASYSGGKYSFNGRSAILDFFTKSMARAGVLSAHHVHHPEIDLVGADRARGIWAMEDTFIDEDSGVTIRGAAFYEDEYVKVAGAWKIKHTGYKRTFEEMETHASRPGRTLTQRAT
jgi:hypothetical protein